MKSAFEISRLAHRRQCAGRSHTLIQRISNNSGPLPDWIFRNGLQKRGRRRRSPERQRRRTLLLHPELD
ncbi:hypothetical protein [Tahibacter aquaticus]|uniref:hypothetical protein n=1 Tax=Tahibacter aquaticus TaxID=520092 RepID=UPI001AAD80DD|nr:hypothetical protein [Tahibacter aquaticus]